MASRARCLLAALLLAGCSSAPQPDTNEDNGAGEDAPLVEADAFDAVVMSPAPDNATGADTTPIAITVYTPEHREGERYPLILHGHGWGGNRVTEEEADGEFDSTTFYSVEIDAQVRRFQNDGYAVISMDQRGFQDSGGAVRIMDPDFEIVDAMAVLDWAEANLELRIGDDGTPLIGTIGGSYGGGYQLLLAALDERVNAITPAVTWYDLPQSLAPNGVIKKIWVIGLCVTARLDRELSDDIDALCREAAELPTTRFIDEVDPELVSVIAGHGMNAFELRHADPDDPFRMRAVDALLTQGQRDVLFPLNEAAANYRFLASLGGDVRLITHQHGHIIGPPLTQQQPLGAMRCGALDTIEAKHAWFAEKLMGKAGAAAAIPSVCLSLDDTGGMALDDVPRGSETFAVDIPDTTTVFSTQNNFGGAAPTFIPLAEPVGEAGATLAGIPEADLVVEPLLPGQRVSAFVGIGVQPADGSPRLVDDQVTPVQDGEHLGLALAGVAEQLAPGDQVGLLLYGSHDEFEDATNSSWLDNNYAISGIVRLPVHVR